MRDIDVLARRLVAALRHERAAHGGLVEGLLQELSLSSTEGVALMCLAEGLLRIPDDATRDLLIRDKIGHGHWREHIGKSPSAFVNAAAWGLMLTGRLVATRSQGTLSDTLTRLIAKGGEPVVRKGVDMAMRVLGEQFVTGQTIEEALYRSRKLEARGFRYSYDMLGEAATTAEDAARYMALYEHAIDAIGSASSGRGIVKGPGISIKLSALHPRYVRGQRERVMDELLPRLRRLALLARRHDIGLNLDAEEADRLELSLDLLEALCFDEALAGWDGIGFVVQAYQKRCPFVIDHLVDLARRSRRRLMVRLVKGAYWDSEIKRAQQAGMPDYPVYTRKVHTDVAYLACVRRLLAAPDAVYPQFATHNAHTVAAVHEMAEAVSTGPDAYEFQCLHGMGEPLYDEVVGSLAEGKLDRPCRIYAPVGTHETLLAYLVRRLLENGANSSFVNRVADPSVDIDALVADPVSRAASLTPRGRPHDAIALPEDIYAGRKGSIGIDLCDEQVLMRLGARLQARDAERASRRDEAGPCPPGARAVTNPADRRELVGWVAEASAHDVEIALRGATASSRLWRATSAEDRSAVLEAAAAALQTQMPELVSLMVREAGKSVPNAIGEVREAIDFLRYYAEQARTTLASALHEPLGVVACISPWNFPLSIFIGQVAAALVAGNAVIAKPAEQTPLVASMAVRMLHEAGVPHETLQLLPGDGEAVGAALVADPRVQGVLFTGSTAVARSIAQTLAARLDHRGRPVTLIAETGGQNAMLVDSSALTEQVVADVLQSAFDSAGQRCSALRVLCLQDDIADHTLAMIRGAMQELCVGLPHKLRTDVGPVIDEDARAELESYVAGRIEEGCTVHRSVLAPECLHGSFVAPTIVELGSVRALEREVFGPVLHVVRYRREAIDGLLADIEATGYGLTFGLHTRIDETVDHVLERVRAGNVYVNRNMVGAVVGVQPFGGRGLSGTGPKAGGPLYLHRLLASGPQLPLPLGGPCVLAGPTGERNSYDIRPRGKVLCWPTSQAGAMAQWQAVDQTGNTALWVDTAAARAFIDAGIATDALERGARVTLVPPDKAAEADIDAVLFEGGGTEGDTPALQVLCHAIAHRQGTIIPVQSLTRSEAEAGCCYPLAPLIQERSISINTAATGGNAMLMTTAESG